MSCWLVIIKLHVLKDAVKSPMLTHHTTKRESLVLLKGYPPNKQNCRGKWPLAMTFHLWLQESCSARQHNKPVTLSAHSCGAKRGITFSTPVTVATPLYQCKFIYRKVKSGQPSLLCPTPGIFKILVPLLALSWLRALSVTRWPGTHLPAYWICRAFCVYITPGARASV